MPRKPQELIRKSPFYPYADRLRKVIDVVGRRFDYFRAEIESKFQPTAVSHPLKLYAVDPNDVEVALQKDALEDSFLRLSPVVGGKWDKEVENIENYDIIYSLEKHFDQGLEWEETDLYSRAISCIEGEKKWLGHSDLPNREELNLYLEKIDKLYQKIKSEGYRTQKDLSEDRKLSFWVPNSTAYERHEITVHIGRDGELILEDGWHRFAIARAMEIDQVPVRIAVRHRKWQQGPKKLPEYGKGR